MGTLRKLGEGDKVWADKTKSKASKFGFIANTKPRPTGSFGNKIYGVYIKQNKKSKIHDYKGLLNSI